MPGRLIIFCGIPGSGKTTVARLVAKSNPGTVHIQTDDIRFMISEPNFSANESEFVYEACTAVAKEALNNGRTVILDATFGSSRRRAVTLSSLEGDYSRADIVHVVCDLETALQRNSLRPAPARVPEESLRGIASAFEVPESAITVNTSEVAPEASAKLVVGALFNSAFSSGEEGPRQSSGSQAI